MKIQWAYLRKGWTSCKNAQEFLGKKRLEPQEIVDARVTRFDADQAWELLKDANSVTVAKGKKVQRFENPPAQQEMLLQSVMGPSGNLRAPTFRVGKDYVIGFNPDLYHDWTDE